MCWGHGSFKCCQLINYSNVNVTEAAMADDFDVEAMLEASYRKEVGLSKSSWVLMIFKKKECFPIVAGNHRTSSAIHSPHVTELG